MYIIGRYAAIIHCILVKCPFWYDPQPKDSPILGTYFAHSDGVHGGTGHKPRVPVMLKSYLTSKYAPDQWILIRGDGETGDPVVAKYVNLWFSNGLGLDISSFSYIMSTGGGVAMLYCPSSYYRVVLGLWWVLHGARATEEYRSGFLTSEELNESLLTNCGSESRSSADPCILAQARCGSGLVSGVEQSGNLGGLVYWRHRRFRLNSLDL